MRRPSLTLGALLAGLTAVPLAGLLYLGMVFIGAPFLPFDLFDWLARILPGRIITLGIDSMVSLIVALGLGPIDVVAKALEQMTGLLLFLLGMSLMGLVIAWTIRRTRRSGIGVGLLAGLGVLILASALEAVRGRGIGSPVAFLWLAGLLLTWGVVLGRLLGPSRRENRKSASPPTELSRRALLATTGVSTAITLVAWSLGRFLESQQEATGAGQPLRDLPRAGQAPVTGRSGKPAPGTRSAITSNADFYRIDIDTRPPVIDGDRWKLKVDGLFEKPTSLSLRQIMAYPPVTQTITQSCISNPIGGDLIGTTRYTGTRLRAVLADLGLGPAAKALELHSADGFFESVTMQDMLDSRTLLVYGMNGVSLPISHGFPLRIYIPDHYGMKQPKWIVGMTAVDHEGPGYWEERGWSREARPHIISIIDTVATQHSESNRLPIGGIAWAGDRGIDRVELQVDEGPWERAEILQPTLGPLAWVLWRFEWPLAKGRHTFRVRAVDGTGSMQIGIASGTFPNGATGYDSKTVIV